MTDTRSLPEPPTPGDVVAALGRLGLTVDDIAPAELRERAAALHLALQALRVQLAPLCDLGDELLEQLVRCQHVADELLAGRLDTETLNELDVPTGTRSLWAELSLISIQSDPERMHRTWPRPNTQGAR